MSKDNAKARITDPLKSYGYSKKERRDAIRAEQAATSEAKKAFARKLRMAMSEQSLTVRDVAEMTNISREHISRMRMGRLFPGRTSTLKRLADVLGVTCDYLIRDRGLE